MFVRGKGELKSQEGTTQGVSVAMGLFTLRITPLMTAVNPPSESMHHSSGNPFYNVGFADDFTHGKLDSLKQWFGETYRLGPFIGFYVNTIKIRVVVKDHELEKSFRIFTGTRIKIVSDGRRHLGQVIEKNTDEWCK